MKINGQEYESEKEKKKQNIFTRFKKTSEIRSPSVVMKDPLTTNLVIEEGDAAPYADDVPYLILKR